MCDLIEANKHETVDLIHCGEILLTQSPLNFIVVCKYCNVCFDHCNGFMRHILNGYHADALGARQVQSDVDVYSVEELINDNTRCVQATADDVVINDAENDMPPDAVVSAADHQGFAESLIEAIAAEDDIEQARDSAVTGFNDCTEFQVHDSGCVSLENDNELTERSHQQCSSIADVCDVLGDSAINSLKVSTANSEQSNTLSESVREVRYDVSDVLDDSAISSLKGSTANCEQFNTLSANVHEATYDGNDSLLKEIDALLSAEEHTAISMESQRKSKKSPQPPLSNHSAFQGKRKKAEMYKDEDDDANKENTPPKKIFALHTPANVDRMSTELIDSNMQQHANIQRIPVKRPSSGNRPKLIRMSAAPLQTQSNSQSERMLHRKDDNVDSTVLYDVKRMDHQVKDEQLSMNLSNETINISLIQLDEGEVASESNMEGISLLDASLVSLPERNDLDASILAVTANTQTALLNVESGDEELFSKVGLLCIRTPSFDNSLTLAEEDAIHARARVFAEELQKCNSIWDRTISSDSEEVFRTLATYLNTRLQVNLSTKDLKAIINELLAWYQTLHQNQLINKKSPTKWVRYYLRLFAFLPKLTRFTIYCEECSASFRMKRDYAKHKERKHNSTIEI